jgi:hypothetical protein
MIFPTSLAFFSMPAKLSIIPETWMCQRENPDISAGALPSLVVLISEL